MTRLLFPFLLFFLVSQLPAQDGPEAMQPDSLASANRVEIEKDPEGRVSLLVGGNLFEVNGVGGSGSKELLVKCGGNSFRTWAIDESTGKVLDEAERLGLKVTLGFWMGHERHGFSYEDYSSVTDQIEHFRKAVLQYRSHPALLMWAVGNEMEGYGDGGNPAVWTQVEHLARVAKSLDPHHPVMTVTAEIGGRRVEAINRFCPSVDIHGINSYGGVTDLGDRYRKAGGVKPFLLTEFGTPGSWELSPGKWDRPEEPTSTVKGTHYRKAYSSVHSDPLCLGSYAFTWGAKQEASATWFGMLLPSGERLAAVDALTELWTGKAPENRVPVIKSLEIRGANELLNPGGDLSVDLVASDPEGDTLSVEWELAEDWKEVAEGGDFRPSPPKFPEAVVVSNDKGATFKMPSNGGTYRVYVYVRDGAGGAATGSLSVKVKGEYQAGPSSRIEMPLTVAGGDPRDLQPYAASGWMGDTGKLKVTVDSRENPKVGEHCLKIEFTEPAGWGGIVWQSPAGDWGNQPGGFDLTGAEKLSFWARGEKGGETAKFGIGIIEDDKTYFDTTREEISVTLTPEWKQYEVDLRGKNLVRIKSGFFVVAEAEGLPFEFFVDEVVVE